MDKVQKYRVNSLKVLEIAVDFFGINRVYICNPEATSETSAWMSNGLINKSNDMLLPAVTKPEEDQVYDVTATGDGEFHETEFCSTSLEELFLLRHEV